MRACQDRGTRGTHGRCGWGEEGGCGSQGRGKHREHDVGRKGRKRETLARQGHRGVCMVLDDCDSQHLTDLAAASDSLPDLNLEYSLEGLKLKLKLQYFGHLMRRTDSLEKTLMLGKTEGGRRRGRQRMRWLDGLTDSMDVS